eukprot:1210616-Amphidinium_carterae.1
MSPQAPKKPLGVVLLENFAPVSGVLSSFWTSLMMGDAKRALTRWSELVCLMLGLAARCNHCLVIGSGHEEQDPPLCCVKMSKAHASRLFLQQRVRP